MTEGSLFAGIMGFGEGFRRAGFKNLWAVEKEPFCQKVIRARFPGTEIFDDVKECGKHNLGAVDVLTAGFPCQDLSVAGKRAGLDGARSGLFWEVVRILGEIRPTWFVLENVPGLFSSCEGRDFAVVLNALDELGYGLAWRVLNSQFFGVAQRRRRVFIVGRFGEPCPREVLFEPEGRSGDIAESGEESTDVAFALAASVRGTGDGHGNAWNSNYVAEPITASYAKQADSSNRNAGPINLYIGQRRGGYGDSVWTDGISPRLQSEGFPHTGGADKTPYVAHRASADSDGMRDFTRLPKGLDSARYRALGNAVTVSVANWIAERILEIDHEQSPCVGQGK